MDEESADCILHALIEECDINAPDVSTTGKSVHELMNEAQIFDTKVRCICGLQIPDENLIICTQCGLYSHKKCFRFPDNFDESTFVCPQCNFQLHQIDPLESLNKSIGTFNGLMLSIYNILSQIELYEKEIRELAAQYSNPNPGSMYKSKHDDSYRYYVQTLCRLKEEWKQKTNLLNAMKATYLISGKK